MKNPKILFIMQLPPPVHGASMVNQSIKESKKINQSFDCHYVNLTTASDVNDIGKSGLRKYAKSLFIYFEVLIKIILNRYNLVYITLSPLGIAFYKDAFLVIMLKFFGCKLVFHLHGKGIKKSSEKSSLNRRIYKLVFSKVNIIQLSPILYEDIKQIVSKRKVWFVANGIKENSRTESKIKRTNNQILYLSNMQESKGSFTLLKAAKILKDKGIDFHVNFIGKWHNNEEYKQTWTRYYQENHLSNNVTYLGPKYGAEKESFFEKASCFVLPTYYKNECFPISILEAMSFGLPVVSTNEGAISEIIDNDCNGFIIDKHNPENLANKLLELLKNKNLREKFGKNAKLKFDKNYTMKNFEYNFCKTLVDINNNQKV